MFHNVRLVSLLAIAWHLPSVAESAELGAYVGAAISAVDTDYDWQVDSSDLGSIDDETGGKIIGGLRPIDPLSIELQYGDLGTSEAGVLLLCATPPCPVPEATIDTQALSVSAIGIASVGRIQVLGKVGLARWRVTRDDLFLGRRNSNGTGTAIGVGVGLPIGLFSIRLEFEDMDLDRHGSIESFSIGFMRSLR